MFTISINEALIYSSYAILVTQYDAAFSHYQVWNFSAVGCRTLCFNHSLPIFYTNYNLCIWQLNYQTSPLVAHSVLRFQSPNTQIHRLYQDFFPGCETSFKILWVCCSMLIYSKISLAQTYFFLPYFNREMIFVPLLSCDLINPWNAIFNSFSQPALLHSWIHLNYLQALRQWCKDFCMH